MLKILVEEKKIWKKIKVVIFKYTTINKSKTSILDEILKSLIYKINELDGGYGTQQLTRDFKTYVWVK